MKGDGFRESGQNRKTPGGGNPAPKVAIRTYREFVRWMDRELAKLVERWANAAAPNAWRRPAPPINKGKP